MVDGNLIVNKGPGNYNLCYTFAVDKISTAGTFSGCKGEGAQCQWTYSGETSAFFSSFISAPSILGTLVTNVIMANSLYGGSGSDGNVVNGPVYVPVYNMGFPLQVNAINSGGNSLSVFATGTGITCSGCSTGGYKTSLQNPTNTYLELSSPDSVSGALFNNQYCTDPTGLQMCPTYPITANLPCVLAASTQNSPSPGSIISLSTLLQTSRLYPNNYEICGYESVPPYNPAVHSDGISSSESDTGMFWGFTYFSTYTCNSLSPFCSSRVGPAASINAIQSAACSLYFYVSETLFIIALVIMMIGAVLYSGSSLLPGETRGEAQAYGMGLAVAGAVSAIITVVSIYFLLAAAGQSIGQVLLLNSCSAPPQITTTTTSTSTSTTSISTTSTTSTSTSITTSTSTSTTTTIIVYTCGNGCNSGTCAPGQTCTQTSTTGCGANHSRPIFKCT